MVPNAVVRRASAAKDGLLRSCSRSLIWEMEKPEAIDNSARMSPRSVRRARSRCPSVRTVMT